MLSLIQIILYRVGRVRVVNLMSRQKWKCPFFEKKIFWWRKKTVFTPINKHFVFLKKIIFLFLKKNAFLGNFFFKAFPPTKNLSNFFWNFFEKKISKKTFFFFKKRKCLFIGVKKFFSPPKNLICKKLSVR